MPNEPLSQPQLSSQSELLDWVVSHYGNPSHVTLTTHIVSVPLFGGSKEYGHGATYFEALRNLYRNLGYCKRDWYVEGDKR